MDNIKCLSCGIPLILNPKVSMSQLYRGRTYTVCADTLECPTCGFSVLRDGEMDSILRQVKDLHAAATKL